MNKISRRSFITGISSAASLLLPFSLSSKNIGSRIKLSVFTDEISNDFGRALEIAAEEFKISFVELRNLWGKSLLDLDTNEIAESQRLLKKYGLKVSNIASPLFKIHWPGAPLPAGQKNGVSSKLSTLAQQDIILERGIEAAHRYGTSLLRCFDFWRLADRGPYQAAIDEKLREAAIKAGKNRVTLALENEYACNTATEAEAVRTLNAVNVPSFKLIWDPGNSVWMGGKPFPEGYAALPKNRIAHIHVKDVIIKPNGAFEWAPVGRGVIDFVGIFQALRKSGYQGAVSLETHWKGAGSPEESTRQSMAGLKEAMKKAGAI